MELDPLDLAVIRGRLQQITDEMDLVHTRAAISPIVSEMSDRANSMVDPWRLEVVTQGKTGLPIFVSTMQAAARAIVEQLGEPLLEGDVVVLNDPFLCGTHLQDIKLLRPFVVDGEIMMLLINTGHYVDVGSASAAGFDPGATDIFQEGLQIPPTFLCRGGEIRQDVLRLLMRNTRLPVAQEGDVRAQMNALDVGVRRLQALVEAYGAAKLRQAIEELARRSEEQMRGYLRGVPDGLYRGRDVVEVSDSEQLTIELAITLKNGSVEIDFTGSSPVRPGPANLARPTAETAIFLAFKHLFPEVPINGGCFRPFRFHFPENCFLAAEWPNATGGYPEPAQRVADALFMAIADVLPNKVCAASFGVGGAITFSGRDEKGNFFASLFPMCGGYGGSLGSDGLVHGPTPIGIANFPKLEAFEHDFPLRWQSLSIRPDSAGAGRFRGGPGTVFQVRALRPMTASYLGDRARHGAFGVLGGASAAWSEVSFHTAQGVFGGPGVGRLRAIALQPGDLIEMKSGGGGGYGPARERDAAALAADIENGVVSRQAAETVWGRKPG